MCFSVISTSSLKSHLSLTFNFGPQTLHITVTGRSLRKSYPCPGCQFIRNNPRIPKRPDLIEAVISRLVAKLSSPDSSASIGSVTERRRAKEIIATYLDLIGIEESGKGDDHLTSSFEYAQLSMSLVVDEAIRAWAKRRTAQSSKVKELMQALSGAEDRLRALDLTYRGSILSPQVDRDNIAKQISMIDEDIKDLKSEIKAAGISIAESSVEKAVPITAVQQLLDDNEVVLLYMVSKEKSHGWSISNSVAYRFDVNVENSALKKMVRDLRASLTPQAFGARASYPAGLAHWLYKELIAPGLERQPQSSKIIIIPDGPLVEVPYAALRLSETPSIDHDGVDNAWLISSYAVSLSPSISALRALRTTVPKSSARNAFLGIGDPILETESSPSVVESDVYSAFYDTRGLGDPSKLSALGSLPDTADELNQIASIFDDSKSQIYLGARATETTVRNLPTQDFRVVAFATHGLLAGSIIGHGEPALVLTPPMEPSLTDDGLLSASEISMMQFDADLVILSACDTAAGGPDVDAMGLSGLARAFFLAGTRNVLASNWPVVSNAARELTIAMFHEIEVDPQLSYAEALRLAMIEVRDNGGNESSDHPFYWAPFVLIGQ